MHHIGIDQSRLTALLSEGNVADVDGLTDGFTPEDMKRVANKILSMKGEIRREREKPSGDQMLTRILFIGCRLASQGLNPLPLTLSLLTRKRIIISYPLKRPLTFILHDLGLIRGCHHVRLIPIPQIASCSIPKSWKRSSRRTVPSPFGTP